MQEENRNRLKVKNAELDQLLQATFLKMVNEIADTRSRNLINNYLVHYSDIGIYLSDKSIVNKWFGVGKQSAVVIMYFIDVFYKEYLRIVKSGSKNALLGLIAIDYPFLTREELEFVKGHLQTTGNYPMFYIAKSFFRQAEDKKTEIIANANGILGRHKSLQDIAASYGLSRERIRQLNSMSVINGSRYPKIWDKERWRHYPFFFGGYSEKSVSESMLFTRINTDWEELRRRENLGEMDLYGALTILSQFKPLVVVSLMPDGTRTMGGQPLMPESSPKNKALSSIPVITFAYDKQLQSFRFADAMSMVGHEAAMQRTYDRHMSLTEVVDNYFLETPDEKTRQMTTEMMAKLLPLYKSVEVDGDDVILKANRINYAEILYQILKSNGNPMSVEDIYAELLKKIPNDHHRDSSFVRSYLLRDERIQSVGSKSTYQLAEWGRFAGTLGELAAHLLESYETPMPVEHICSMMMKQRKTTTRKSCTTSIYLAVRDGLLMYYIDTTGSSNCIGLTNKKYDARYWPSPVMVEGAIRSMRRFLEENGRWPFPSRGNGIESTLHYVMKKYMKRKRVKEEKLKKFQQGMADINPYAYPSNDRELVFANRCRDLAEFYEKNKRMPENDEKPELVMWFKNVSNHPSPLDGCRNYHFQKLLKIIGKKSTQIVH